MSDTYITVDDPDDVFGPPAYGGPADKAGTVLAPGTYDAFDEDDRPVRVTVNADGESTVTR